MFNSGKYMLVVVAAFSTILPVVCSAGVLPHMTRSEAARAQYCCVTGVVTMTSSWRPNSCVIAALADPNGEAVYVSGETFLAKDSTLEGSSALQNGQIVEVEGETAKFSFAPGIKAKSFKVLGHMELPQPPELRLRDFDFGQRDNRRARMRGVLTKATKGKVNELIGEQVSYTRLELLTADGPFVAHISSTPERWRNLIDAELLLDGVAMTFFNLRAEFLGVQLEIASPDDITILKEPPKNPFALPVRQLDELFSSVNIDDLLHRQKVHGIVTYSKKGEFFYIQNGNHTLKVRTESTTPLSPGEIVDVAGFAVTRDNVGELVNAIYKVTGRKADSSLEPIEVIPDYLFALPANPDGSIVNFDGTVVRLTGRWMRSEIIGGEAVGYLMCGKLVKIHAPISMAENWGDWDDFNPNIVVTGVCSLTMQTDLPEGRSPEMRSMDIYIDQRPNFGTNPVHDDIWKQHTRNHIIFCLFFSLAICALLAFTVQLVRWRKMRSDAHRLAAIIAERKRMAADLHDTIEQHIAGAKMLLKSALASDHGIASDTKEAIDAATGILVQAKAEMREAVWNLRSDELFEEDPATVIKRIAKRINQTGATRVRTSLRAMPKKLNRDLFADVVFITQEAITNAVKHGKAKNIAIVTDPDGEDIVFSILNDGEPFDTEAALGPEAGHFGLSGMRERAERNGIDLTFGRLEKWIAVNLKIFKVAKNG